MSKLHASRSREWLDAESSDNLTTYATVYAPNDDAPPFVVADAALQLGGDVVHLCVDASTMQEVEEALTKLKAVITALEAFEGRVREAAKHLRDS